MSPGARDPLLLAIDPPRGRGTARFPELARGRRRAGALAVLGSLWLAVAGVTPGGAVLGLLLLFVLTGPIAFAGWRVLRD